MLLSPIALHGQFFLYSETPIDLEAKFSRHTIESRAKESFFNALKITNKANRTETFTLNITVPQGWSVIGSDKIEMQIDPLDSIIVPIRIAIGSNVRGDIGYSVIASLTDNRGNTIKNAYCYVKIPREVDLNARFIDRIVYIDPSTGSTAFSILLSNKGNREEPVTFIFNGNNYLGIGRAAQTHYSHDVVVNPYSDTVFTFHSEIKATETFGRTNFGMDVLITSIDTTISSTIWMRRLGSRHANQIPASEKMLVVDLVGQGLLDASRKPTLSATVQGKVLLNGDNDVYYYYRNFASRQTVDFYKTNRMHIGGNYGKFNLELGDNYRSFASRLYGRGAYFAYNGTEFRTEMVANRDERIDTENYGGIFSYYFTPNDHAKVGAAYTRSTVTDFESKLGLVGGGVNLFENHSLYAHIAYNEVNRELDGQNTHNEFGGEMRYRSRVGKFNNTLRVRYASPMFYSPQAGRFQIFGNSQYQIDPNNRLTLYYNESSIARPIIQENVTVRTNRSQMREGKIEYLYFATPTIQVFGGPGVEQYQWEGLQLFPDDQNFSSIGYKMYAGSRLRNSAGTTVIVPKIEVARVNVLNNPFELMGRPTRSWFNYQFFSLNFRSPYISVLAFYTTGPKSVLDQINYTQYARPNRRLQFMPAFDGFIYQDVLRAYLGLSYSNDIVSESSYSNLTGQLFWYLPNHWRLHSLLVYTIQNRTTPQENIERYQNLYLEAGIRKEFDFNQPRVKYHDATFVFFRDYNGNYSQDPNEPGIRNVLVTITKESSDVIGRIPGDLYSAELITDNFGRIILEKIPEGRYKVTYNPIGDEAGTFSKALGDMIVHVNYAGEYYFPFVEKNKVTGKIVLNRSRLSGLGRIDVSNVRITATDSQGRSFSTLTDRTGEFTLYAPATDEYVLSINNIFYENFDLRQNNFLVQFNGYKQFEVNFVFDEKVRRIHFATAPEAETPAGVQQVRRTNISGTVKDANSLRPIRARVNIVNTRNNQIVSSTFSSATSGDYTLTFVAGENYLLEVVAEDYWYLSENLTLNQVTTFMNINRDVLLRQITVGSNVELNIPFNVNDDMLAPEAVAELNRLLRILRQNLSIRLEIQGHCDDLEAMQRPEVALERAQAVASFLIENGFSNLEVVSQTNTDPRDTNNTPEGRARNRRVEAIVISR